MAGAEANAHITSTELRRRGHQVGILHGPSTGKNEEGWRATFPQSYSLGTGDVSTTTREALRSFDPELVYVHKMADLAVIRVLARLSILGRLLRNILEANLEFLRKRRGSEVGSGRFSV